MKRRELLERAGNVFAMVVSTNARHTTSIVTPTTGPGVSRAAGQTDILDASGGPRP